jgi:hypothetical protein
LRSGGKTVIGAGEQGKAPRTLVKSCDRYFYLNQAKGTKEAEQEPLLPDDNIENLVKRAATASINEHGKVFGSKLNQTIQRLDPSFHYSTYKYSTFTKFIEAQPYLKITRPRGSGDIAIELADAEVPKASAPSQMEDVWLRIDEAWSKHIGNKKSLPGPRAAIEAAKILGLANISTSQYKNLQGLLNASDYLSSKWRRDKNTIIKR